jgi:ketosteroid isomerase-like protein
MSSLLRFAPVFRFAPIFALATTLTSAGCGEADAPSRVPSADPVVEAHIQLMLTRIAANNSKDWDTWEGLHVPGAVRTAPELPAPLVGASAMRAGIEELVKTFPDYNLQLVDAFGEGNRVMARIHAKGTMLGPIDINGTQVPPTGKAFEQDWVGVVTFDGNKISAIDEFHDNYGLLVQLGLSE